MKKFLSAFMMLFILAMYSASAYNIPQFTAESMGSDAEPLLEKVDGAKGYWFPFKGKNYIIGTTHSRYAIPYEVKGSEPLWHYSCVPAGDYYIYRSESMDNAWVTYYAMPIYFYDKEFNPVSEYTFKSGVKSVGYFNGKFYAKLVGGETMCSTDRINWEETQEELPRQINGIYYSDSAVSLDGEQMTPIVYEDGHQREMWSTMGDWILKIDENKDWYLSNDNVYFAKIRMPEIENLDVYDLQCIYEYGDNIVIDMRNLWQTEPTPFRNLLRLTVPKQEVYAELEAQKTSPYVKVADEILGFETPPITESDRTLVPMRFLFEKLGAEVSWDQETETATAQKANTVLSFSIDQNSAVVNGQPAAMDVPARLVNDKTMVPLRFLSENLGYTVEWDEATRMATIKE